tara:strand:+ start:122 stop:364 length:243 start_codon:yes stop_codon:yes gene_type:complete
MLIIGTSPKVPTMNYNPRLDKSRQDPVWMMDKMDFLQEVYTDYCALHNLPLVSADEQDDPHHQAWMDNYIQLWEYAEESC